MAKLNDLINQELPVADLTQISIGSFIADVRISDTTTYTSEVSTFYTEDGNNVSDHINNKPIEINIEGQVSNIKYAPTEAQKLELRAVKKLAIFNKYAPKLTIQQSQNILNLKNNVQNKINKIDDAINDYEKLTSVVASNDTNTNKFLDFVETTRKTKSPIKVAIFYSGITKIYENMVITSTSITTDNEEDNLSYSMSLSEIRFVKTDFVELEKISKNSKTSQTKGKIKKGKQQPQDATAKEQSLLSKFF